MSDTASELHPCKCGCGTMVRSQWVRGHWARGEGGGIPDPLPGPGDGPEPDGDDVDDLGEIDLDGPGLFVRDAGPTAGPLKDWAPGPEPGPSWFDVPPEPEPAPEADPAPAKIGKGRKGGAGAKPPRVSAAVRTDIHAKIRFIAVPVTQLWAMRDPICGGAAVQAEPDMSAAFLDIVLQSPDLIALFTGPASAFMVYARLFMAVLPVLQTVYAHHVSHVIELPERDQGEPVDAAQYAA